MKHVEEIAQELALIFERNDWHWGGLNDDEHVPTVDDIVDTISELNKDLDKNTSEWVSSGRIKIERLENGKVLSLIAYSTAL